MSLDYPDLLSILFFIFALCLSQIVFLISNCRIFKKMGARQYKAVIPFYHHFVLFKTIGVTRVIPAVYTGAFFASTLCLVLSCFTKSPERELYIAICVFSAFVLFVFSLIILFVKAFKLSDYFGKGSKFKLGMVLLQPLFTLGLAFGRSRFLKNEVE